jgi:RsiW-degrading membrane proteinase PrsW (M82 family)
MFFYAFVGGVLPAVFWLWFWLGEDSKKPEPRGLLLVSFFAGALAVVPALYLEVWTRDMLADPLSLGLTAFGGSMLVLVLWSVIEEVVKYIATNFIDFHNKAFDEPVDAMVYLITVALGFAACENFFFIVKSLLSGTAIDGANTIFSRFLGANLLHLLASAALGGIIALAYCKSRWIKILYTLMGLIVASALHSLFNYFILQDNRVSTLVVLGGLWFGIIVLLLFFEKVKRVVCIIKLKT